MLPENIKFSFFETKFIYRIEEVVKLNSFYLNYTLYQWLVCENRDFFFSQQVNFRNSAPQK